MAERIINNDWQDVLEGEFLKPYFRRLQEFLDEEYANHAVNPERNLIYRALELTPFEKVKVAIVGQDPYYGQNQDVATGLAFSAPKWMNPPPRSTRNIYEVLRRDLGYAPVSHGCLESWARQGVLLLNSILTVRQGTKAMTHADETPGLNGQGWSIFTDAIIRNLSERKEAMVFILWGEIAMQKMKDINKRHLILTAPHPNADYYDENNAGFFETRPFSEANAWLSTHGVAPIDWNLPAN